MKAVTSFRVPVYNPRSHGKIVVVIAGFPLSALNGQSTTLTYLGVCLMCLALKGKCLPWVISAFGGFVKF